MDSIFCRAYLFLDLSNWTITQETNQPEHCWLLASSVSVLQKRSWRSSFLASAGTEHHKPSPTQPWTSLSYARDFLEDLRAGRAANFVPPNLVRHLDRVARAGDPEQAFGYERQAFAELFKQGLPQAGLCGFLAKNPTPFEVSVKLTRELETVLAWLDHQFGTDH